MIHDSVKQHQNKLISSCQAFLVFFKILIENFVPLLSMEPQTSQTSDLENISTPPQTEETAPIKLSSSSPNNNLSLPAPTLSDGGCENFPDYSSPSIRRAMRAMKLKELDVNESLSSVDMYQKPGEPADFAALRYASHCRLCVSNRVALLKYLKKNQKKKEQSLTPSTPSFANDVEDKIKHAHEMVAASKRRVRERALRKFKVERETELVKQKLLANAKRHTEKHEKREKIRLKRIQEHRAMEARSKVEMKVKSDAAFKLESERARIAHEKETKEQREHDAVQKANHDMVEAALQKKRHDFLVKTNHDKEVREKQEAILAAKREAAALKRIADVEEKGRQKRNAQEKHRLHNIQERERELIEMKKNVNDKEKKRVEALKKVQKEREERIQKHERMKEKDAILLKVRIQKKNAKIHAIQQQKEKLWKDYEEKMLSMIHVGNHSHNTFKERKEMEARKEALTQQLYRQEMQVKVERQKLLDQQIADEIKERIKLKSIKLDGMAEKRAHMDIERQKMERETLIFKKKIIDVMEESTRTSNWDVSHQHRLFGRDEVDEEKLEEEEVNAAMKAAANDVKRLSQGRGERRVAAPHARHQKHAPRWVAGHSDHSHLFDHIEMHDNDLHEDHLRIIQGSGSMMRPVRPSERLGASHNYRRASPRKASLVKKLSSPIRRSVKASVKRRGGVGSKGGRGKAATKEAVVVLPTSREQLPW